MRHKYRTFWAVTIFNLVWLIKIRFWMVFFLILSWPDPKSRQSGARQTCKRPPTFPAQSFQSPFGTKGQHLFLVPRVLRKLSTWQAKQQMETVFHCANQITCHLSPWCRGRKGWEVPTYMLRLGLKWPPAPPGSSKLSSGLSKTQHSQLTKSCWGPTVCQALC